MSGESMREVDLLPPAGQEITICQGKIYCGFWRHGQHRHWRRLDLANDAIILEDLEGVFINKVDRTAIAKS